MAPKIIEPGFMKMFAIAKQDGLLIRVRFLKKSIFVFLHLVSCEHCINYQVLYLKLKQKQYLPKSFQKSLYENFRNITSDYITYHIPKAMH